MEPKPLPGGQAFELQVPPYQPPPGAAPPGAPPGYAPGYPPGYAPGYPPAYPPGYAPMPAKNSTAPAVIIIVVVVIVVALLLIVPIMYVLVSGLGPGPGNTTTSPTMVLSPGSWNAGNLSAGVTSVTNGGNLNPVDLTYVVSNAGGTTYYTGAAGLNTTTAGTLVNVRYQDNLNVGQVSAGDSIIITAFPYSGNAISGGTFKVFYQEKQISTLTIP